MENSLTDFLEELKEDSSIALNETILFKTRMIRRIKRFAIVDTEYFWENSELLSRAKKECQIELTTIRLHFEAEEKYELCQAALEMEPKIDQIYSKIYTDKIKQMDSANGNEVI